LATGFIQHPACQRHDMGPGHPEAPRRLSLIEDELAARGVLDLLTHLEAPLATREQLERVHTREYLDRLAALAPQEGLVHLDPDTSMCPHTLEAAYHAAGAAVLATDRVLRGQLDNAFCCVRPPGHHAMPAEAMGFCFFNNVAVAAAHALAVHGLQRVVVLDFDVHHGNGTEAIFEHEPGVLVCSAYQHPLYPFSGAPSVPGRIVNVELPAETRGQDYRHAIDALWGPAVDAFRPQLVLVSAGFDAHVEDPTADLMLNDRDYEWLTDWVLDVARRHAAGRIVSCLEGGYAAGALSRCAARHVQLLAGL
jgi:acetoin utilization deacetylase AcuC-like enzyme